jgi:hypothetical protein
LERIRAVVDPWHVTTRESARRHDVDYCPVCQDEDEPLCRYCNRCEECCCCESGDFDADELGLDPETDIER